MTSTEDVKAELLASSIAAEVMCNDHLLHRLDEQQQDEVHGDVQEIVLRALLALRQSSSFTQGYENGLTEAANIARQKRSEWLRIGDLKLAVSAAEEIEALIRRAASCALPIPQAPGEKR